MVTTAGASRVASAPRCLHAVAHTPAGPMNPFAHTVASASAFPVRKAGRLLHYPFRGLLSVHLRYGLHAHRVALATLCTEGFSGFVTSTTASIVTGRNEPVPGRDFHPLWTSAFSRRTQTSGLPQCQSDTPRGAGGLVSGAASKAVAQVVLSSR